jgi:excisionase family DNA binding protein
MADPYDEADDDGDDGFTLLMDGTMIEDPVFYVAEPDAPPPSREQLQTVAQIAKRLQVTDRTVRNLLASGELPSYAVGTARRIDPADVDAYLAGRRG